MILTNGGRRIATATGAMLADPDSLGNLPQDAAESLFDPEFWRSRGELQDVRGGRDRRGSSRRGAPMGACGIFGAGIHRAMVAGRLCVDG